jgi:hypothetical protein
VAVEVDGSHHYTNSVPHVPLSEVVVRRRMLQVGPASAGLLICAGLFLLAGLLGVSWRALMFKLFLISLVPVRSQ